MAYTAYRVLRAPIDKIEDLMTAAIADGWQPLGTLVLGTLVLTTPDTNMVYQAIVKGSAESQALDTLEGRVTALELAQVPTP